MAHGVQDYYFPYDQLETVATKLDTVATKLDTVAGKLDDVITEVAGRRFEGYAEITTTCKQIIDIRHAGYFNANFYAHPDNSNTIKVYLLSDCSGAQICELSAGQLFCVAGLTTDLSCKSTSGTQYLKVQVTGRSTT